MTKACAHNVHPYTYHTYVLEIENFEKTEKKLVRETELKISLVTPQYP